MKLPDLLRTLRTRWPIIAVVTTIFVVSAWLLLPSKLPQPDDQLGVRATSTLVLETGSAPAANNAGGGAKAGANQLNTLKVIASEGEVPAQVAAALGTPVPALLSRVSITSSPTTNTLSIVALDRTREGAVKTADTYSTKLLGLLRSQAEAARKASERGLTQQISQLEADKALLEANAKADPVAGKPGLDALNRQLQAQKVKLGDLTAAPPPTAPLRSIGPPTVRRLATAQTADRFLRLPVRLGLAGLLGMGVSLAGIVLLDRFDVRLRTKEEAELAYGLPVLAEVPVLPRRRRGSLLVASEPHGPYAESHRILRTSVLRSDPAASDRLPHERPRSCLIVVTSADPGEGKSSTAANLAASFAEAGSNTILVGLDLRHNDLHTLVPTGPGSEEIQIPTGRDTAGVIRVLVRGTGIRDLRLVTLSPPPLDPPAIVLPLVAAWLRGLKDQVDVIVVDTPPLLVCNDTSEIVPFADTVVLTCRVGMTTAEATARATEVLARLRAPVCGVVLVGATLRAPVRKVAAYGAAGWGPAQDGNDGPGTGGPGRGLGPAEPMGPWRASAPSRLSEPADEAEPSRPAVEAPVPASVPVRDDQGTTGDELAARLDVPAPPPVEPRLGHDAGGAGEPGAPPEPDSSGSRSAPEASWRPVPVPAASPSAIARRTLDLALQRVGRRRRR